MDGNYISLKITAADLHLKCVLDAEAFAPEFDFCRRYSWFREQLHGIAAE